MSRPAIEREGGYVARWRVRRSGRAASLHPDRLAAIEAAAERMAA